jgi:hypothetical protein
MHTKFWMKSLKGRGHSKDLGVNWEDDIKMDIRETELRVVDWIHLCGEGIDPIGWL